MRARTVFLLALISLSSLGARTDAPTVTAAEARVEFPDRIVFSLQAESDAELQLVQLEYGLQIESCATDVTRVVPEDFEPAHSVDASWTWDMRQTGSLPPGARLWWRWRVQDSAGGNATTETRWLTWLDDDHPWQTVSAQGINLHWYAGAEPFAQQLLESAVAAQSRLADEIGARPQTDVDLYIYDTTEAMQDAILFEPQWTGGQAYYDYNIVIIGINDGNLSWGLGAIAHEMAHIVVHDAVSHCYSSLPTWLDEGLAVHAAGALDDDSRAALDQAIAADDLFSLRALSDGFGEHPAAATVSYAESYSLVAYLLDTYGRDKMLAFLQAFQEGYRYESALERVYGLSVEELEAEWRAALGAAPMTLDANREPSDRTPLPTFPPYQQAPAAATATPLPTRLPTPTPAAGNPQLPAGALAASAILAVVIAACCVAAILAGSLGLAFWLLSRRAR